MRSGSNSRGRSISRSRSRGHLSLRSRSRGSLSLRSRSRRSRSRSRSRQSSSSSSQSRRRGRRRESRSRGSAAVAVHRQIRGSVAKALGVEPKLPALGLDGLIIGSYILAPEVNPVSMLGLISNSPLHCTVIAGVDEPKGWQNALHVAECGIESCPLGEVFQQKWLDLLQRKSVLSLADEDELPLFVLTHKDFIVKLQSMEVYSRSCGTDCKFQYHVLQLTTKGDVQFVVGVLNCPPSSDDLPDTIMEALRKSVRVEALRFLIGVFPKDRSGGLQQLFKEEGASCSTPYVQPWRAADDDVAFPNWIVVFGDAQDIISMCTVAVSFFSRGH